MNAWSKLPNAKHIDWVLESMKSNPDIWFQSHNFLASKEAWEQAYNEAWNEARNQVRDQVLDQAKNLTLVRASGRWNRTYFQIVSVLLALVAYDDCEKYLCMTYSELKTWALVSENPQAILLLPLVYVKEQLNEKALV